MKQRWKYAIVLLAAGCMIAGIAFLQMPERPDRSVVTDAEAINIVHPPEIFTEERAYRSSLAIHGLKNLNEEVAWDNLQVVHFSGTLSTMGQDLDYGVYVRQSLGETPELISACGSYIMHAPSETYHLADETSHSLTVTTDRVYFHAETVLIQTRSSAPAVRDGWHIHAVPRSVSYPLSWDQTFQLEEEQST